jgi:hypothetical protein
MAGDKTLTKKILSFHGILTAKFCHCVSRKRGWAGDISLPADTEAASGRRVARYHSEIDRSTM